MRNYDPSFKFLSPQVVEIWPSEGNGFAIETSSCITADFSSIVTIIFKGIDSSIKGFFQNHLIVELLTTPTSTTSGFSSA